MNLSINGQSRVPPGFRFHPTEEELLQYYLRKKVAYEKIDLDVIREVDLNKLEPWDIQENCRIGSAPQNDWYFFSRKDKKYPTGTRTNRATAAGFWKATGRDKIICSGRGRIGSRKTLVFYRGRAPHGQKSDWIMHEYRLEESKKEENALASSVDMNVLEDGWVVCRVFRKKDYQKAFDSPQSRSTKKPATSTGSELQVSNSDACNQASVLDQVLSYMGKTPSKVKNKTTLKLKYPQNNNDSDSNDDGTSDCSSNKDRYQLPPDQAMYQERFINPPSLDSPCSTPHLSHFQQILAEPGPAHSSDAATPEYSELLPGLSGLSDWAALDRLFALQLNGQTEYPEHAGEFCCFGNDEVDLHQMRLNGVNNNQSLQTLGFESDFFWSNFTVTSSSSPSTDPLRHFSV